MIDTADAADATDTPDEVAALAALSARLAVLERETAALKAEANALRATAAVHEAERAVRRTMTRYMALCDVPGGALEGESLAALFTADAVWEGIGPKYVGKFGRLTGHAAILAMLNRYLPPSPHFSVNVHFLTSETIEVRDATAKGRWIMLQASGYVDAQAELISARLEVDFAAAANERDWLISHFRTERLFDAPWQVNPGHQP